MTQNDMMRYGKLRVLKIWRDGQFNLAHSTETKKLVKTKNKNRVAQNKQ